VHVSSSLKPSRTFLLAAFMPGRFGPIYLAYGIGLGWPLGCQLTWSLLVVVVKEASAWGRQKSFRHSARVSCLATLERKEQSHLPKF